MADIRYVCLSDLHLGAANSVLSHVPRVGGHVDPTTPSPVLEALVACLRAVCGADASGGSGGSRPTLVLVGDVLELALAADGVAQTTFEQLVELALVPEPPLFDETVWFVAGNHDHHVWEMARERQYADYVATVPWGEPLKSPRHTTPLLAAEDAGAAGDDAGPVVAEAMTTLVRRHPRLGDVTVAAAYPNLGLRSPDGRRWVVLHHGHFVESMYRLVSGLRDLAFPARGQPSTAEVWEAENFAWIDFFWSALGRSGVAGRDVGLLYDMLQSEKALDAVAANLASGLAMRGGGSRLRRAATRFGLKVALDRAAGRAARIERHVPTVPLSARAEEGLRAYLAGPVAASIAHEADGAPPEELTFVFGHTHKPFQRTLRGAGVGSVRSVEVLNTGGWVVDTVGPEPVQGGAAVVLDAELNAASLRLYQQSAGGPVGVRVEAAAGHEGPNPLLDELRETIDPASPPWSDLTAAATATVSRRHTDLAQVITRAERAAASRHRPPPPRG